MAATGKSVSMDRSEWASVERRVSALGLSRASYFQMMHRMELSQDLLGKLIRPARKHNHNKAVS